MIFFVGWVMLFSIARLNMERRSLRGVRGEMMDPVESSRAELYCRVGPSCIVESSQAELYCMLF